MTDLQSLFAQYIKRENRERDVALLLSGGIDSISVGLALTHAGRQVHGYTYELEGYSSVDRPKARSCSPLWVASDHRDGPDHSSEPRFHLPCGGGGVPSEGAIRGDVSATLRSARGYRV